MGPHKLSKNDSPKLHGLSVKLNSQGETTIFTPKIFHLLSYGKNIYVQFRKRMPMHFFRLHELLEIE